MRSIRHYVPLLVLLMMCLPLAQAQSQVDFNVGFGWAHAKSLGLVDTSTLNPCSNLAGESCASTPDLSNFMLGFGGNLLLWKHFGIGVDVAIQPAKQDYIVLDPNDKLQSRVTLYDFDAIYAQYSTKKVQVQLKGGIGGANTKFYVNSSSSSTVLGNQNFTQYAGSANHFALNGGLGIQLYLSDHVFVRPEVSYHYVHNFQQFGSNSVVQAMIWLGYSIGDR